jgi:hypothetical protein
MAPLRNTRHEKFVQSLLEGKSAAAAYEEAGYAKDDGNATRLAKNPKVIERLTELQNAIAEKIQVTVESLVNELEEARKRADSLDQLSAVVKAISEKARISGLMVQKIEVGAPGDFSKCETIEAVVDELLALRPRPVSPGHRSRPQGPNRAIQTPLRRGRRVRRQHQSPPRRRCAR